LECPARPLLSVAAPPFNTLLPLLSEAAGAQGSVKGRILLIVPLWTAQPWWPLALRLSQGIFWTFRGLPWISPAGKRASFRAVAFWVG
jgi:hypothetical protein